MTSCFVKVLVNYGSAWIKLYIQYLSYHVVVGNLNVSLLYYLLSPKVQIIYSDFDNIEQLMFRKMNLKNVNYDYSALVLSWDPENEVIQSNEKEILS